MRADGSYFGTLCALDGRPARLPDEKLEIFHLLAELIASQLEQDDIKTEREHFIAALGHDLRSPLGAIVTSAAVLDAVDGLPAAARSSVARIEASATRMQALVDDLLDVARGRMGEGMALQRSRVDLAPLIERVIDEAAARRRGSVQVEASGDLTLTGDEGRLGQLLSNLLVNALEHDAGEGVRVSAEADDSEIVLEVRNGGEPIPAELLPRLFEPFQRGREASSGGGLGLGLYIAAEVAHAHGGTIDATSDRERGTCFVVRLPRGDDAARSG